MSEHDSIGGLIFGAVFGFLILFAVFSYIFPSWSHVQTGVISFIIMESRL